MVVIVVVVGWGRVSEGGMRWKRLCTPGVRGRGVIGEGMRWLSGCGGAKRGGMV